MTPAEVPEPVNLEQPETGNLEMNAFARATVPLECNRGGVGFQIVLPHPGVPVGVVRFFLAPGPPFLPMGAQMQMTAHIPDS